MQGRQRRSFTEDYKRQAVELVVSNGRSVTSVAKELGLRDSVLRRWVERLGREPTAAARRPMTQATPTSADQAAEIARLRHENERLRMERDILKNCPAPGAPVRGRNSLVLSSAAGRIAAARLLEAQSPLKNMVHGCMRT
jgi:transposase